MFINQTKKVSEPTLSKLSKTLNMRHQRKRCTIVCTLLFFSLNISLVVPSADDAIFNTFENSKRHVDRPSSSHLNKDEKLNRDKALYSTTKSRVVNDKEISDTSNTKKRRRKKRNNKSNKIFYLSDVEMSSNAVLKSTSAKSTSDYLNSSSPRRSDNNENEASPKPKTKAKSKRRRKKKKIARIIPEAKIDQSMIFDYPQAKKTSLHSQSSITSKTKPNENEPEIQSSEKLIMQKNNNELHQTQIQNATPTHSYQTNVENDEKQKIQRSSNTQKISSHNLPQRPRQEQYHMSTTPNLTPANTDPLTTTTTTVKNVPKSIPTSSTTTKWIKNYLSTHKSDHLLPVPRDFIMDGFNLQGLQDIVESKLPSTVYKAGIFRAALKLILDQKTSTLRSTTSTTTITSSPYINTSISTTTPITYTQPTLEEIQKLAANIVYPLLHSRFIVSPRGLFSVSRALRQNAALFGRCPRQFCKGMPLLPCGSKDNELGTGRCMRYCCSCGEVLYMWDSSVDGCAWGTSFCHLLLMVYGEELFPSLSILASSRLSSSNEKHRIIQRQIDNERYNRAHSANAPSIFGFRIHPFEASIRYPISKRVLLYNMKKNND